VALAQPLELPLSFLTSEGSNSVPYDEELSNGDLSSRSEGDENVIESTDLVGNPGAVKTAVYTQCFEN
jgi:hypothetical protein